MILCQCAGVTDRTIRKLIAEGARSLAEIARGCGAGRCCQPCREEIAAMLYRQSAPKHTDKKEQTTDQAECGTP